MMCAFGGLRPPVRSLDVRAELVDVDLGRLRETQRMCPRHRHMRSAREAPRLDHGEREITARGRCRGCSAGCSCGSLWILRTSSERCDVSGGWKSLSLPGCEALEFTGTCKTKHRWGPMAWRMNGGEKPPAGRPRCLCSSCDVRPRPRSWLLHVIISVDISGRATTGESGLEATKS
jgi:hypothetical protein